MTDWPIRETCLTWEAYVEQVLVALKHEVDGLRTAPKADEMVRTSVRENADAACAENAILCISIADALDALDPGDAEEPQP